MVFYSLRHTLYVRVVFFLVLHLLGHAVSALDELQDCYEKVTQADSNGDMQLDTNDFLTLIKLCNNTFTGVVDRLSPKQLEYFMGASKCSCLSDPFTNGTCCTPENSRIPVPSGDLSILEQVGLALLCEQALLLSSDMEVEYVVPTDSPMPSSASALPTIAPSQRVVNKEITTAPTLPSGPQLSPPYTDPTELPSLPLQVDDPTYNPSSFIATLPPIEVPTMPSNLPSQSVSVDEPTTAPLLDYTSPPTPLPVESKEIPEGVPSSPLSSPPDSKPTNFPSGAVVETPVNAPVLPPFESPTSKDALCINSMRLADAYGNQRLTLDEYVVFLRKYSQCTGVQSDEVVWLLFHTTKCFHKPSTCATDDTLDISSFYISSDIRDIFDEAEIQTVCDTASTYLLIYPYCVDLPTAEPSDIPTASTNPPIDAPVEEVTDSPIDPSPVIAPPTKTPIALPPIPSREGPAKIPTLSPESAQGPSPPDDCRIRLILADSDKDSLLTQEEFLSFIYLQPGCESITALSSEQIDTFNSLAALCLNAAGADALCAQPRNARVSIDGIYNIETDEQRAAISYVCSETENACKIIPPVASPGTNSPISPIASPGTNSPVAPPTSGVTPDAPIPSINEPNQVQPIVPTNEPPDFPSAVSPAGIAGPQSPSVDSPALPVVRVTTFPTTSQEPAPSEPPATSPLPDSVSPPLGVEDVPPDICVNATLASDINEDGYLSQDEYLSFIQRYSECDLINILSAQQRAMFQNLACSCLNDPIASPDCCLPGNAKVFVDASLKLSYKTYSLSEVCFLTATTFTDECVAPATMNPIKYPDLDQCSYDLVESDKNENGLMDKQEYLVFIQKFGQCQAFQTLDLGHYSVFQTMACECVNLGESVDCCLPGNATLNISGASLPDSNRTQDQISMLSKICITASGLTTRECEAMAVETPMIDCTDSLLTADDNSDDFLDVNEYLYFLQDTYTNCSGIEWLSFSQRVAFGLLACSCLLEPGAELECCFAANARINITGAGNERVRAQTQQNQFLSTICTASKAAADIGCRTALPTPAPTRNATVVVTSSPPVVTKTSVTAASSLDDSKLSPTKSQAPKLNLQATWLIFIVAVLFRV